MHKNWKICKYTFGTCEIGSAELGTGMLDIRRGTRTLGCDPVLLRLRKSRDSPSIIPRMLRHRHWEEELASMVAPTPHPTPHPPPTNFWLWQPMGTSLRDLGESVTATTLPTRWARSGLTGGVMEHQDWDRWAEAGQWGHCGQVPHTVTSSDCAWERAAEAQESLRPKLVLLPEKGRCSQFRAACSLSPRGSHFLLPFIRVVRQETNPTDLPPFPTKNCHSPTLILQILPTFHWWQNTRESLARKGPWYPVPQHTFHPLPSATNSQESSTVTGLSGPHCFTRSPCGPASCSCSVGDPPGWLGNHLRMQVREVPAVRAEQTQSITERSHTHDPQRSHSLQCVWNKEVPSPPSNSHLSGCIQHSSWNFWDTLLCVLTLILILTWFNLYEIGGCDLFWIGSSVLWPHITLRWL